VTVSWQDSFKISFNLHLNPPVLQQTTSELWCLPVPRPRDLLSSALSGGKRGDYQNCSVLYCVLKLCTVIGTLRWTVLTVLWIGFRHTGPISLCLDSFVFMCLYFVCSCFTLNSYSLVSALGWTWWDWCLILRTYLPSVLWHCWLDHLTRKNPSPIWPIMCLVGC